MKATIAAAAVAALAGGVSAGSVHHRHAHAHDAFRALEKKDYNNGTCGCTTIYSTYYGEATLSFPPVPATTSVPAPVSPTSTPAPVSTTSTAIVVPTPVPQTCSTTGVYTFPATTVTLTESTTVCVPSTTSVPSGTHTIGGVTTVVTTETTVTCPYATVSTTGGVTTSVIETTTYVCPSAGTYTIAPTTITVSQPTTVTVPAVTSYTPGTYTQPEVVTTVTETSTVVYCPFDIPTPSASTTPVQASSTSAVQVPTSYPAISVSISVPVILPASSSYPTSSSPSESQPTGTLGGEAGKPWGISYTPYETGPEGGCKSASEVASDIAAIAAAGIKTVRVYSTDCDTLTNVGGAAADHGIKLILGLFIDAPGCDAHNPSVSEQISAIKSWAQWDLVELISVGNEAIFHGYCQPSELAALITKCKGEFSGYTGKYTTAETVNIWQQSDVSAALCPVVDVTGANAHAFFNTETDASQAGQFIKGQLDIVDSICEGTSGIILETGWPSQGSAMGLAVPGEAQQAEAISGIVKECGDKAVLFSLTSDQWKDGTTACHCEQHFGLAKQLGITLSVSI
ncbi:glycoside hydrolase family 17 protein [Hypoxylon sp. FL0890]|nr:glycoside hydrolase family 17 protein [Hypoxylon sp. FL0890]